MKERCERGWKTIIKGAGEVMIIKQQRKQHYT